MEIAELGAGATFIMSGVSLASLWLQIRVRAGRSRSWHQERLDVLRDLPPGSHLRLRSSDGALVSVDISRAWPLEDDS